MNIVLLGMNHRSAPVDVREGFAVQDPGPLLTKLVASEEITEAVLVSTCNRVEIVALASEPEAARLRLRAFFQRELGSGSSLPDGVALEELLYEHRGSVAMQHVMRVAASLDSLVVGEPQILGQMKDAYRAAVEAGACGPILSRLFQRAFAAAKRVRRETALAQRPISVARVAVDLARQVFEGFHDKAALLVGAGDMIELALQALRGQGLGAVRVANRSAAHARELAARFDASAHTLEELPGLLASSDLVLTCIGGDQPLVTCELVREALHRRRERPLFLVDIGVPRNVEATVNRLDNAYLYDLDDLSSLAEANAEERRRETLVAEAIVLEEQQRFDGWLAALEAVPTIRRLRSRAESIRRDELDRTLGRLQLDESQRAGVEQLTRAIVNKLLHAPISRLRDAAEQDDGLAHLEAARALFEIDEREAPGAAGEGGGEDDPEGSTEG